MTTPAPGYDYASWLEGVNSILEFDLVDPTSATPFGTDQINQFMPRAIEFAEQSVYRDLDLLATRVTDSSGVTTGSSRTFTLPTDIGRFIVLEQVSLTVGDQRQAPLLPVSKDALDAFWPSDTPPGTPSIPTMWCPVDQVSILLGPAPDAAYTVNCFGTQRPQALSSTNVTTLLTLYEPDLFFAGTMIAWADFQRDTEMAGAWQAVYQQKLQSVNVESFRSKLMSQGWTTRLPSPIASPQQN
jgi:hypothetical protein